MKICGNCERYIKTHEATCPFCGGQELLLEARAVATTERSRAGVYAARAVIATAALGAAVACGDDSKEGEDSANTGGASSGGMTAATGGEDGGDGDKGTGGDDNIDPSEGGFGGDNQNFGGVIPIYGGPFPDQMKARV